MENIPTAEEFLQNSDKTTFNSIEETMIRFTKLHVKAALIAAHNNMQLPDEDIEFTLDSYHSENIR